MTTSTDTPAPSPDNPVRAAPAQHPRVVVIGTVTHVPPAGEATSVGGGHTVVLKTDDQPYRRVGLKVGPEWRPLDLGWLAESGSGVSLVVLENLEGTGRQAVPTPEERQETARRVVEVSVAGQSAGATVWDADEEDEPRPGFLVGPGHVQPLAPANASLVRVRCRNGLTARCSITLFPL